MKRYAKHNQLNFIDFYAETHMGYKTVFMDEEKEMRSREYARNLFEKLNK